MVTEPLASVNNASILAIYKLALCAIDASSAGGQYGTNKMYIHRIAKYKMGQSGK